MGLQLRIIKDPCRDVPKPRVRTFGEQGGDIGRAPDSYWVLPDPKGYVSSQHCSVEYHDGAYWLRDTSRNGVYLNGSREPLGRGREVPLRHGDRVRVAEYELLVRVQQTPGEAGQLNGRNRLDDAAALDSLDGDGGDQSGSTGSHATLGWIDTGDTASGEYSSPAADLAATVALLETSGDTGAATAEPPAAGAAPATEAPSSPPAEAAHEPPGRQEHALLARTRTLVATAIDRLWQGGGTSREKPHPRADWNPTDTGGFTASMQGRAPRNFKVTKNATFDRAVMEKNCVLLSSSDAAAFNSYKILRTRLRRRMASSQWRSIGISGAAEGVGKTLTALNLGITFAHDPRSPAILVDLDLYRPKLASYLGMSFDKGLTDYLLGEAEIGEVVYSTSFPGLVIVPNGRPLQNASELLASQRMSDLVLALESLHPQRTIIYDMPPLLMSDDVLLFSPHMDCMLDVIAVGVTPRAALERSKEVLSELNVIGSVVNRAAGEDSPNYYYYYR